MREEMIDGSIGRCMDRHRWKQEEYVQLKKEWEAWIRDGRWEEEREEDEEEMFG